MKNLKPDFYMMLVIMGVLTMANWKGAIADQWMEKYKTTKF